jgi:hypothetical protein
MTRRVPQGDYKRCVFPTRDSLKGITNDVLLLLGTPSRGLQTMCFSYSGLPQGNYKRCVIPARDKCITYNKLFLDKMSSSNTKCNALEGVPSRNNTSFVIPLWESRVGKTHRL